MITWKRAENKRLGKFFSADEFECPCKKCDEQKIDEKLIEKLDEVRETYGKAVRITSGYRCPAHNKAIGGKENSSHMSGLASDIAPVITTLEELDNLYEICYNVFDNIGDGRLRRFVHVDTREKKPTGKRLWMY
jgi:uncharacterized protein YcbK (DUF882 family)